MAARLTTYVVVAIVAATLIAGLIVPLFMMRDLFKRNEITAPCPSCGTTIKTSDATLHLTCPNCDRLITVRDMALVLAAENEPPAQ